ncbi:MAG: hypothetical protein HOL38_13135 [Verrucomicrobia bacterium]|jgi:hypothetical protein|nr:hypothetical protein [Verrucomicrobiota bacterium]
MNRIKLPVLAAVALVIAGCQTANQLAYDEQVSIFRPELWLKDDALYYAAGAAEPYTGKHEAWYVNGDKAWEGEMIKGKRHGQYTQWYPEKGGRHVAGLYKGGSRDGAWGQWYPNGKAEILSDYLAGSESKVTFYSESGNVVPEKVYWAKVRQRLNRQTWRSYGVAYGRGYSSQHHSSYYHGSHGWTPPGGGTASDFSNLSGGGSYGGGGSSGGGGGGGASVGAPEGRSGGSPSTP